MQLLSLGKRELVNKLITIKPTSLLWLSVVFSIISTEIIVVPMSIFFNGKVSYDYFVTGLVCASLVSMVVSYLLIHLISKLRGSEKEKDALLHEIHHRVKNNMQIILSLLSIQARNIEDKQLLAIFQDCQNRIKAMALVHEELYQSKNLSRIDVKHYLDALLQGLSSSLLKKADVRLKVTIDNIFFNIDTAIPCGLIITELVTNSFKHAFLEQVEGEISVVIRQENGTFILSVKDNGAGLPEGLDTSKTTSLGFQLVRGLTGQLGGTINIESDHGTETMIIFKELKTAG